MIQDLPKFPGIPDEFIRALNERFRMVPTSSATSGSTDVANPVDLSKAVNFGPEFRKYGGQFVVNFVPVDKLAAGDAVFLTEATFSCSGGGKITISSTGITLEKGAVKVELTGGAAGCFTFSGPSGNVVINTAVATSIAIAGNQVLAARYPSVPVTLGDVITIIRYHGLSG